MDHYKEFTAIAKEIGLKGKEMRDFIEEKVSIAEEKARIAEEKEQLRKAEEKENQRIAEEKERQRLIIEREERAEKRELEQIKNDNLKLRIELESRGQNPGNETNRRSAPRDTIKVRKYDSQKEKNGCLSGLFRIHNGYERL